MLIGLAKKVLRAFLNKDAEESFVLRIDNTSTITVEHQNESCEIPQDIWVDALQEVHMVPSCEIKALLPEAEWMRIPYPVGIPNPRMELESKIYFMFDGGQPPPSTMAHFDTTERRDLLASLSNELYRVRYHYERFLFIIETAKKRKQATNAMVSSDMIMRYAYYEASSMIASARSVAEQLVHICLRINWAHFSSNNEREKFRTAAVFDPSSKGIRASLREIEIFRNHKNWFEKLNTYRNVMIHQGWKVSRSPGYYESGDQLPESKKVERNPMFLPDDTSLTGNKRPHLWTYQNGDRLDDFLASLQSDIEKLTDELITFWGATVPPSAQVPYEEQPNILAVRHFIVPMIDGDFVVVPVFTQEAKVIPYYKSQNPTFDNVIPCTINANKDTDGLLHQGYHFQLINTPDLIADLQRHGIKLPRQVRVIVDPLPYIPTVQQKILAQFPFRQDEHDHKEGKIGKGITLTLESMNNADQIFVGRRKPS